MKKISIILVMLFWCNVGFAGDYALEGKIPIGSDKKLMCKTTGKTKRLKGTSLANHGWLFCHGLAEKHYIYFPEHRTEIITEGRSNVYFVYKNVYRRMTCTSMMCKKGDGTLKKIAYSRGEALAIANPEYAKKLEEDKKKREEERKKAEKKRKEEEKRKAEKPKDQDKKESQSSEINPNLIAIGSGTGFYINNKGYALTNNHVVEICEQVITIIEGKKILFNIVATDQVTDIGLIKSNYKVSGYLNIETDGAKLGEDVIAVGYPLAGRLSDSVKITKGIVSALSGIGNNSAQIQIDAALQPGNSGGPILNKSGDVVGIASAGLNKLLMAKEAKYIPENVNFAVATPSIATFLKTKKIKYSTGSFFSKEYSTHELAEIGQKSTIQLFCLNTRAAYAKLKRSKKYTDVLLDLN